MSYIVSEHAWKRWKQRFPKGSMIDALARAKPCEDFWKARFFTSCGRMRVLRYNNAIFLVAEKKDVVVTVLYIPRALIEKCKELCPELLPHKKGPKGKRNKK